MCREWNSCALIADDSAGLVTITFMHGAWPLPTVSSSNAPDEKRGFSYWRRLGLRNWNGNRIDAAFVFLLLEALLLFTLKRRASLSRNFVAPSKGLPFSGLMLRRFGSHIALLRRSERSPSQSQATQMSPAHSTKNHNRAAHLEKSKEFFLPPFYLRSKKRRSAVGPRPDGFCC